MDGEGAVAPVRQRVVPPRRMVVLEALTIAAFGTLLGLVSALFGAWAVGALANGAIPQYTLKIPWGTLLLVCLLSLAAGALAALVPAQRAAAMRPLEATAQA
ncbi:FtsX-like permease family protein [Nonomuraea sp. NPDC049655]|uniref:FtsX-like permease family protein n=1 Tax=Nonomuraea sp. NPDC049655 TaxID=3364355 RepID=UPI0037B4BD59